MQVSLRIKCPSLGVVGECPLLVAISFGDMVMYIFLVVSLVSGPPVID